MPHAHTLLIILVEEQWTGVSMTGLQSCVALHQSWPNKCYGLIAGSVSVKYRTISILRHTAKIERKIMDNVSTSEVWAPW